MIYFKTSGIVNCSNCGKVLVNPSPAENKSKCSNCNEENEYDIYYLIHRLSKLDMETLKEPTMLCAACVFHHVFADANLNGWMHCMRYFQQRFEEDTNNNDTVPNG